MLVDEDVEVLVGGEGDKGIKVEVEELVLEVEGEGDRGFLCSVEAERESDKDG